MVAYGSFWNLDETQHVTEFFKLERKNQLRFFFCTLCSQLLLVFQVLGSTFGFGYIVKKLLCLWTHVQGNKVFVLPKKCTLLQSANFPTTLLWLGNLEWAQICMLCVCLFIKLCRNDKPGTTLNSTAMSSQLTFCVALCHKIMPKTAIWQPQKVVLPRSCNKLGPLQIGQLACVQNPTEWWLNSELQQSLSFDIFKMPTNKGHPAQTIEL